MEATLKFIGHINTPYEAIDDCPNTDRNKTKQGSNKGSNTGGKFIGTFALRSPHRPNPIGAAVLPIEAIHNGVISVKGLDCLNGTHLLDIKPAILDEDSNRKS